MYSVQEASQALRRHYHHYWSGRLNRASTLRRYLPVLTLISATITGCVDAVSPRSVRSDDRSVVPDLQAVPPFTEFQHIGRFEVRAEVQGTFRVGQPVRVNARVRANVATRTAELRIYAPEVALLRAGKFAGSGRISGVTVAPEALISTEFGVAGEERIIGASFVVPSPGYYRVLIEAKAGTEASMIDGPNTIQNTVYDEIWFTIEEQGGQVTGQYDPKVLSQGLIQRAGPYQPLQGVSDQNPTSMTALLSDPLTLQMTYYNRDDAAWQPLVDARYRLVLSSGTTYTGQTNSNGEVTYPCAAPNTTGMLDVWYESAGKTSVIRHATVGTLAFHGYVPVDLCGNYVSAIVDQSLNGNASARVFTNAIINVNGSRQKFPSRASIAYKMSTNVPDTYYDIPNDRIQIDTFATWGSYGIFGVSHEYGHALHHKALGGIQTSSGTCPQTHLFTGYYNYGCAYSEGFANYHAAVVRGAAGAFFSQISGGINHGGQDGATNEGGVAAFLYDLSDPAGLNYAAWYVADIYRTCDTHTNPLGLWVRASGIDHMVYCFERAVDPTAQAYFRGGSTAFDNQRESATEPASWNQMAIRTVWLANLFNQ